MLGNKMKISKSPWKLSKHGTQIVDNYNRVILEASQFVHHEDLENVADNMKLASLAPNMYEILKTIIFEDELSDRTKYWIKGFFEQVDPDILEAAKNNINPKKG